MTSPEWNEYEDECILETIQEYEYTPLEYIKTFMISFSNLLVLVNSSDKKFAKKFHNLFESLSEQELVCFDIVLETISRILELENYIKE